jgi:DNA-binding MarR family transcriptional regulator
VYIHLVVMGEQEFNSILQGVMGMDSCTCGQLRKAARAVTLLYDNAFKSSGLLSTQLGVLHAICKSESIKISDLANELDMDRTTLTRNLSILERQGFIKISTGKDHRTRIVTATTKGRTAVTKALPLWNEIQRNVRQEMGENKWHDLIENLSQFVNAADRLSSSNTKH